jgi:hypothetical protein
VALTARRGPEPEGITIDDETHRSDRPDDHPDDQADDHPGAHSGDHRTPWPEFPSPGSGWDEVQDSDADSVELKMLLAAEPDTAAARLTGRGSPRWRTRQMHLLDTPGLSLARAGLEVRLRRRARGRHDLTVRVRHHDAGPSGRPSGARVELDLLPGAAWRTVELRHDLDDAVAADWSAGLVTPRQLFSPHQADWTSQQLGAGRASEVADALVVHGPLVVHRLRVPSSRFPVARARIEHCRYDGGRTLVEFSARCAPRETPAIAAAMCTFLGGHGIVVADRHRTKTALWVDDLAGAG